MKKPDYNTLNWVFFASKGITDNSDLMRTSMLCMAVETQGENATIESIKNSDGFKSCIHDIPDHLISDEKIQELIDFKI